MLSRETNKGLSIGGVPGTFPVCWAHLSTAIEGIEAKGHTAPAVNRSLDGISTGLYNKEFQNLSRRFSSYFLQIVLHYPVVRHRRLMASHRLMFRQPPRKLKVLLVSKVIGGQFQEKKEPIS
jgi:hypothetical protein